jgi:hypothetical protein
MCLKKLSMHFYELTVQRTKKVFLSSFSAVVSNHIRSIATFATIVETKVLLSPLLSEFERYTVYLPLELQF